MPDAVRRAFASMFPQDRSKIQNPLRRGAAQMYDKAAADPTVQFMLQGHNPQQMQAQMRQMGMPQPPAPSPHGQIRPMTGHERIANAVNRVIPRPVQQAARIIGDPMEWVEGPAGPAKAMMGLRTKAKNLGLKTKRFERHGVHNIHVVDPQMQTRYADKRLRGQPLKPAGQGLDAYGIAGGDIGAYINYTKHSRLPPESADMFKLETGLNLKEKPPTYRVEYTKTLERPDPKANPNDPFAPGITIEPAYSGEAFHDLLKVGAEENPGKIYAIEASLINSDLVRLAENFGIIGFEHGYGANAVYFAKNGRLIPLPKAMKELGSAGPNLSGRTADKVAAEYAVKKKAAKQEARKQALEFQKHRRSMSEEEAAAAAMQADETAQASIDWMGEGQPPARVPREEGPIGFDDTPEWLRDFYQSTPSTNARFAEAFDDAMGMHHNIGMSPANIEHELRVNGYPDDIVSEVMREVRGTGAAYDMAIREQGDEILEQGARNLSTQAEPREIEQLMTGRTAPWTEADNARVRRQREASSRQNLSENRYPTREEVEEMLKRRGYFDY